MDAGQGCEPSRRILRRDVACGLQLPASHSFCKTVGTAGKTPALLQLVSSGLHSLSSRVLSRLLAASSSELGRQRPNCRPPSPQGPCQSLRYTKAEAEEEEEETW